MASPESGWGSQVVIVISGQLFKNQDAFLLGQDK